MEKDRRKSIRVRTSFIVQYGYYVNDKGKKMWDMTVIRDISEVGMRITTHKSFSPNDILNFRLRIPSDPFQYLNFNGKVVESEESKAARHLTRIEFMDLEEEQKELIRIYVEWFLSKQREA